MIPAPTTYAAAAALLGVALYLALAPSAPPSGGARERVALATPPALAPAGETLGSEPRELAQRATALDTAEPTASARRVRFQWDQQVSIGDRTGAGSELRLRIEGVMRWTPLAQYAGEQTIELAFEEISASADLGAEGQVALSDLQQQLAHAAVLYADASGWPLGYHFPAEHSARTRNFVRSMATALAFPIPDDGAILELAGADAGGAFAAELELRLEPSGARRVEKRKHVRAAREDVAPRGDVVPSGRGTARFPDARGPWISAEYVEDLFARVELPGARMEGRLTIRADLVEEQRVRLAGEEHAAWKLERHALAGDAERDDDAAGAQARREREQIRDLHALPLAFELASLVQSGARKSERFAQAWRELRLVLEHDEAQLAEIRHLIESGAFPTEVVDAVLAAVGAAARLEGRRWLVDLARREALAEETRSSALRSLFQGEAPAAEIRSAVRELTSTIADPRSEAGRTALLLLGRYAAQADEEGERAWGALVASAARCAEQALLETWIHAIANSRRSEARALIEAQLRSSNAGVRRAATLALRDLGGR
ncbi:MAG: hypothetical protein IPN34_12890 [Planctomycetes bacterium]|nr:hypothetical protein [Planctomycetota bacterium]